MTPEDIDALLMRAESEIAIAKKLLDAACVARMIGVSSRTMRRWIVMEQVEATRTQGGHYRVPISELQRLLKKVGQIGQAGHAL